MAVKKFPSVLSFQRLIQITDGLFEDEMVDGTRKPLFVVEHGVMGTQNVAGGKKNERQEKGEKSEDAVAKNDSSNRDPRNPHWIESAKTRHDAEATIVSFSVRGIDIKNALFSCASTTPGGAKDMRVMVSDFIEKTKKSDALREIANRYARNIANGRWLFRNRTVAAKVSISVYVLNEEGKTQKDGQGKNINIATFEAFDRPIDHFRDFTPEEKKVGQTLLENWLGNNNGGLLIEARINYGVKGSVEVFPSQDYLPSDKDRAKKADRSLYKKSISDSAGQTEIQSGETIVGQAALRDQKIGNALRTIDNWYPDASENGGRPIAVEPEGASLEHMAFYRKTDGKSSASAFDLFKKLDQIDPEKNPQDPAALFSIACLIRGGVYGESEK